MRSLPPLVAGPHRLILPMADRSAAALAEWLLTAAAPRAAAGLTEVLADDPPLLVWSVCRAGQADFSCRNVGDAAGWLAEHALAALQWPAEHDAPGEEGLAPEVWPQRVAAAVTLSDLAAQLAAENQADRDEAVLGGLLYYADDWLGEASRRVYPGGWAAPGNRGDKPRRSLPAVAQAVEVLAGGATDAAAEAAHRRGAAAAGRWAAQLGGPTDWLPSLAARLARLAALEDRFRETLDQEKLAALAEFAAGAGHEINNPLTVIAGRAQLFLQEETNPERRRALALINAQAMRVYEMIADLRLFARPPQPELQPLDLVELVDELIAELAPLAAQQESALVRGGDGGPVAVVADPTQLAVALRALCQNALEALGGQGHVRIELGRRAGGVEIRVRDDGPGIPPEQRRHIFDPFYSARQAGRGLGLGLSKCWRIITNHGGRIAVEDQPGGGACFLITLPR
ncbi:MAG: sensor histidine kinase [Thermoguttaceae bacterium]